MASKNAPDLIVSGAGWGMQFLVNLTNALKECGWDNERIHQLVTSNGEEDMKRGVMAFVDAIVEKTNNFIQSTHTIVVDYGKSFSGMVKDGHYNYANEHITAENFPVSGKGKVKTEVVLFHFDRDISSEEAIAEMEKAGFRPGKIEELLALGSQEPELQREFPIVALESVWRNPDGDRNVPCLSRWYGKRLLGLGWFDRRWSADYRFLAVRA